MSLLILGLLIFFAAHWLLVVPGWRAALASRLGVNGRKALVALVSLGGFVLLVYGWQRAGAESLYAPPAFGYGLTHWLMLPALILLVAAYAPSNIRWFTRHPMLWATVLWAAGHLAANGELRAVLLFGAFGLWALLTMWLINRRDEPQPARRVAWPMEWLVLAAGVAAWLLLARFHALFTGVALRSPWH